MSEMTKASEVTALLANKDPVIETMRKAGLADSPTITLAYALIADRKDRDKALLDDNARLRSATSLALGLATRGADRAGCDGWQAQEMCRQIVSILNGEPTPCYECGSTKRTGTACKPCNPEITDETFGLKALSHHTERKSP